MCACVVQWQREFAAVPSHWVIDAYGAIDAKDAREARELLLSYIEMEKDGTRSAVLGGDAGGFAAMCLQRDDAAVLASLFSDEEPPPSLRADVARAFLLTGDMPRAQRLMQADAVGSVEGRRPALELLLQSNAAARVVEILLTHGCAAADADVARRALALTDANRRSAALAMRLAEVTHDNADVTAAWRVAQAARLSTDWAIWRLRIAPRDAQALSTLAQWG